MNRKMMILNEGLNLIQSLLQEVQKLLQNQFIGFYIHGSLAMGDFNPESSDIDFLVVTEEMISEEVFHSLAKIHHNFIVSGMKWAKKLEGSYIPKKFLLSKEPPITLRPHINSGTFCYAQYGYEWVLERYVTREFGIILEGPDPKTLIPYISLMELQQASQQILQEWWVPMLSDPSRLHSDEYQVYAVLTMCRILHLWTNGIMASKKQSAEWVLISLDAKWRPLIEQALQWKTGFHFERMEDVLELIQFTFTYCKR